jgi:hypothetical protein
MKRTIILVLTAHVYTHISIIFDIFEIKQHKHTTQKLLSFSILCEQPNKSTSLELNIQQIIHRLISQFFEVCFITNTIKKSKLATTKIITTILSRVKTIHVYQWNKVEAIIKPLPFITNVKI